MPATDGRHSWRHRARQVWQSDDDTATNLHLRDIEAAADRARTRDVVDLVMRIADLALATGASASEATGMVLRICDAHGVKVHVDITNTAVVVSQPGGTAHDPVTAMRTVRGRSMDHQRLSRLEGLVHRLSHRSLTLAEARARFNDIVVAPRTYRRWVVVVASALMGGAIALLLGGGPVETVLSTLSAGLVEVGLRTLRRARVPQFFANMVAAVVPTLTAIVTVAAWPDPTSHPSPSIIVGAGIVSMLAGLNLVSAARDALDGYYLTSAARIYEAVVMTAAIVVGVTLTLGVAMMLGVQTHLSTAARGTVPLWQQLLCAALIGLTFAVTCQAGPRTVALATGLAMLTQTAAFASSHVTTYRPLTAGFAAMVVAAVATWGAPRWHVPVVALVSSGLISQVPGSLIYRGLWAALQHDTGILKADEAPALLSTALLIGAALGIGANLGTLLARPFALPADASSRRALLKSWRRGAGGDDE